MLLPMAKDTGKIRKELESRINVTEKFEKVKLKILSAEFKNNLQGVYGYIDEKAFEKHKKAFIDFSNKQTWL